MLKLTLDLIDHHAVAQSDVGKGIADELLRLQESRHQLPSARLERMLAAPRFREAHQAWSMALVGEGSQAIKAWMKRCTLALGQAETSWEAAVLKALARLDLSGQRFRDTVDLGGLLFPGDISFANTTIETDVWLNASVVLGRVEFTEASCEGTLTLEGSHFEQGVSARGLLVGERLESRSIKALDVIDLSDAKIFGDVWMRKSQFRGGICADHADLIGAWGFGESRVDGQASFRGTAFGGLAGFEQTEFRERADFSDAIFQSTAWFEGARFDGPAVFDRARFRGAMMFDGVHYAEGPAAGARGAIEQLATRLAPDA